MNDKNRRIITILSVFTIIFTLMGGTLAYWVWDSTENTGLAFTITKDFSCYADGGEGISNDNIQLAPIYAKNCATSEYALKKEITLSASMQRNDMTLEMDLWLNVNSIDSTLANNENLRYAISTSDAGGCEEGNTGYVTSGNFKELTTGSRASLLDNIVFTSANLTPKKYYLYIWLDSEETNNLTQNSKFNLSLGGQCTDSGEKFNEKIISLSHANNSNVYVETIETGETSEYETVPANSSAWNTMTLGSGVTIENETEGLFSIKFDCLCFVEDWFEGICASYECSSTNLTLSPKEAGYYRFNGYYEGNNFYLYINDKIVQRYDAYVDMYWGDNEHYLTPEDTINITFETSEYLCSTSCTHEFKIEKAKNSNGKLNTYRYEGKEVDNYITFNNETWRIIGLEDGSVLGLESGKYYPKIVRAESFDKNYHNYPTWVDPTWNYSYINYALNNGYYNKKDVESWLTEEIEEHGYSIYGLSEESRKFIAKAKWEGLVLNDISTVEGTYKKELVRTYKANVGLLSPSDYGFAATQYNCVEDYTTLKNYANCVNYNWLYTGENEWLISDYTDSSDPDVNYWTNLALIINNEGNVTEYLAGDETLSYRPVVYLNPDVIVTGGTGKIDDQYQIELSE
ncbi:MAG: hypothetical protein IJE89_04900 [Bacilli bacterium]|nr:hypothetical protein [Bacilli bacterium]